MTRFTRIFGITAIALCGGFLQADSLTAAAPRPAVRIGVNLHPMQDTYARVSPARALDLAARVGAAMVRVDVHWSWFEFRGPSQSTWYRPEVRSLDTFLDEAARRHIEVLATVDDTPCWAAMRPRWSCPDPASFHGNNPPLDPAPFARFLRRLVALAGARIQAYEIWNEPNLPGFWLSPDPAAYTRLLKSAYAAIKAANPAAIVLGGATSGADVHFITGMYAAGAKGFFDALSIHPYSGDRPPDVCTGPRHSFACGVEAVHRLMLRHDDAHPLWLTELGVGLGSRVSGDTQAQYVRRALALIAGWRYVQGAFWYELYDDPTGHDGQHYGLFDRALVPRKAATAFRQAGRAVTRARR